MHAPLQTARCRETVAWSRKASEERRVKAHGRRLLEDDNHRMQLTFVHEAAAWTAVMPSRSLRYVSRAGGTVPPESPDIVTPSGVSLEAS
jgi:hypothetical protein